MTSPKSPKSRKPFTNVGGGLRILLTQLLAVAAGFLASRLHVPLPWMIGPLFVVAGGSIAGWPLLPLSGGRQMGQWAIGTALGLYFTPAVLAELAAHWPIVFGSALASLVLGAICASVMLRFGRVDVPTAFFSSLPGGASEMANLADRWGGAVDRIAAAHALRVMLVVSIVPVVLTLAGAHGGDIYVPQAREVDWLRFPLLVLAGLGGVAAFTVSRIANAWVLGPLAGVGLVTALNVPLSAMPREVVAAGQLLIGCSLGARFTPTFFRAAPHFVAVATVMALFGQLLAFVLAWLMSSLSNVPLSTLTLATAPGGVAEMCITAQVLQLGVPLVTATHVLRVAVLTVGAPVAYRWFARKYRV